MTGEDERLAIESDSATSSGSSRGRSKGNCTNGTPQVPEELALEIGCAARMNLPVLITGRPEEGKEIACAIDRRSSRPQGTVEVVDCREDGAVGRLLSFTPRESPQTHADRAAIVLLQEVQALSPKEQAEFEVRLAEMRISPRPRVRFIASSSTPLFDRVREGAFDERLYYRLNVIHMIVA